MRIKILKLQPKRRAVDTIVFFLTVSLCFFMVQPSGVFSFFIFDKERIAVYQAAFDYLVVDISSPKKIQIRKQTSFTVIKKFNFKHPSYHVLDTTNFKLSESWKKFLFSVDITHLTNSSIQVEQIMSSKLSVINNKPDAVITFSPAIISSNKSLAVCAYEYIDDFGNDVQGVLLLDKSTSAIWQVCKFFKLGAS